MYIYIYIANNPLYSCIEIEAHLGGVREHLHIKEIYRPNSITAPHYKVELLDFMAFSVLAKMAVQL